MSNLRQEYVSGAVDRTTYAQQSDIAQKYSARMQELESLVGEINMVIISPREDSSKLCIIRALLRADICKERKEDNHE